MPLNEVDKFMYDEGRLSLLQELLAQGGKLSDPIFHFYKMKDTTI